MGKLKSAADIAAEKEFKTIGWKAKIVCGGSNTFRDDEIFVGAKFSLLTLFGRLEFEVVKVNRDFWKATLQSGPKFETFFDWRPDDKIWESSDIYYNPEVIDKCKFDWLIEDCCNGSNARFERESGGSIPSSSANY